MDRRRVLQTAAGIGAALAGGLPLPAAAHPLPQPRIRPGDPGWPTAEDWGGLGRAVGGRLIKVESPLEACRSLPRDADCAALIRQLSNPYFLGDEVALTQSLGWVGAWTSQPSAYAVAAESAADVAAAVDFARRHRLRLVVKGGGHSFKGGSNAPDSLLIWTRRMRAIALHEAFVPAGCAGRIDPQPAATIEAGAMWGQAYDEVTTRGGRYVQGGGCLTVGVVGLLLGGGFGSFSKAFGTAAANLLEAEIVTADGVVRTVNACSEPDFFWALKGGGGGTFGVVTRVTVRTHDLPTTFGGVNATIKARSDGAFRRLIDATLRFYADRLFNAHWGEQLTFRRDNSLAIALTFQGLSQTDAQAIWQPYFAAIAAANGDYAFEGLRTVLATPAQRLWDPQFLRSVPGLVVADSRPGAPRGNVFWAGNRHSAGQVHHGYQSLWLPQILIGEDRRGELADALFEASRHWTIALHVNKGLAGAPAAVREAVADTAMNPLALDAFALAICGAEGPPGHPSIPGREPDERLARERGGAVDRAMRMLKRVVPEVGSYWSESNYFEDDWQRSFFGPHYARLIAVKNACDPNGLFTVRHGVGSERWSADGFTPAL